MFNLNTITRQNIRDLKPYSSARDEFVGTAKILLDANENPNDTNINRYPDPYQNELKLKLAIQKGIRTEEIFIGNGSDEAIDLLFRAFCEPMKDKVYVFTPTYGMYEVSAKINNIELVSIKLNNDFELPDIQTIKNSVDSNGLIIICSPNNPTGNTYSLNQIQEIALEFKGIVAIDEAYIDFSTTESALKLIQKLPNIVILQTMSKAFGAAGLRIGFAFSNKEIIAILNKIKPPYNISTVSQEMALKILKNKENIENQIDQIILQREKMTEALKSLKSVKKVFPSEANFILVEFFNAKEIFLALKKEGIIVRDRTQQIKDTLRITVGTATQNKTVIETLKNIGL